MVVVNVAFSRQHNLTYCRSPESHSILVPPASTFEVSAFDGWTVVHTDDGQSRPSPGTDQRGTKYLAWLDSCAMT